jgi:hypothetical protein
VTGTSDLPATAAWAPAPARRTAVSAHVWRIALTVLTGTLAAVYLAAAGTMAAGHTDAAAVEATIGVTELAGIAAAGIWRERRWPLVTGAVWQLVLIGLWVVSRTAGLPGERRLPIGELDLLCAADALVIAALAVRCASPHRPARRARWPHGLAQLAVMLAVSTVMISAGSLMHTSGSPVPRTGGAVRPAAGAERFFCHLL